MTRALLVVVMLAAAAVACAGVLLAYPPAGLVVTGVVVWAHAYVGLYLSTRGPGGDS